MKKPEEILYHNSGITLYELKEPIIKAMKEYANAKLDEAAEAVRKVIEEDEEEIYIGTVEKLEHSILKLKTNIL